MKSISFSVEHQCPQCGAPVVLGEETLFFACPFCRVRSLISQQGFFRYVLIPPKGENQDMAREQKPDPSREEETLYLPYWRFKGVRYACHPHGVEHRFLDISALAVDTFSTRLPFSLGFRSQALSLKLVSPETKGKFIRPQAFKTVIKNSRDKKKPVFQIDIGEAASLIYAPFYTRRNQLMDGILDRPTGIVLPEDFKIPPRDLCRPEKETLFLSGLCPSCGWDLKGQSDSLVLTCSNCHTLWKARGKELEKISFSCAMPPGKDYILVPFWKISADIKGFAMDSYADLVRMGNLPRALKDGWEEKPLHFWAPAFKIRPKVFLRITTQFAIAQPDPVLEQKLTGHSLMAATLPASEAAQAIRVTLASLVRPLKDHLPDLARARIRPNRASLVFLPFQSGTHELVNGELNLAINKNILALSENL